MSVPVFKPTIRRRDMDAVLTCLVSDSIGPGTLSHELASNLAAYLGIEPGTSVRDYATAIEMVLDALGIARGDQVVISPLAPAIYGTVFERRGVVARLVDVDAVSGSLSTEAVGAILTDGVKAILVHYTVGIIPDTAALSELGVPIVEDISEGLGGITAERRVGTYGQYTIVGLEAEHIITAGGGAVVLGAGKRERAELKRVADALPREILLSDMNAALALQQVRRIEQFVEKRREIASIYNRAILRGRHKMLVQPGEVDNVYFSFPVVLASGAREVMQYARKKQIDAVRAFASSIIAETIASRLRLEESVQQEGGTGEHDERPAEETIDTTAVSYEPHDFPHAQGLYLRCILFPLYPSLTKRDVEKIEKVLTTLP